MNPEDLKNLPIEVRSIIVDEVDKLINENRELINERVKVRLAELEKSVSQEDSSAQD